jgi:hypothetical protein
MGITNGWDGLPSSGGSAITPSFSGLADTSVASSGGKLNEVADRMSWVSDSKTNAANAIAPKDFGAITNGTFSKSMQDGLTGLGQSWSQGFESATGLTGIGTPLGANASTLADLFGNGSEGGNDFAVKLKSRVTGEEFICEIMPTISETGSVSYDGIEIAHHPGTIQKYRTTPSREWSISNIRLASVTVSQADANQMAINLLRSWRMPYYGYGTEEDYAHLLGAPPDVLDFSAYGDKNIGVIPVVISSLSIEWANDCDYIHTSDGQPFPVLMNISLSLLEAWSPKQYSGFSLTAFKAGNLVKAYSTEKVDAANAQAKEDLAASQKEQQSAASTQPPATSSGEVSNEKINKTGVAENKKPDLSVSRNMLMKNKDPALTAKAHEMLGQTNKIQDQQKFSGSDLFAPKPGSVFSAKDTANNIMSSPPSTIGFVTRVKR